MDEQAIAARLTAIAELERFAEQLRCRFGDEHYCPNCDNSMPTASECLAAAQPLLAHVETLTQQVAQADERARLNYPGLAEVERIQQENARLTAECKRLDNAVAEVWDNVHRVVQQAWVKPHDYDDSPLDLIAAVIDERDEAEQQRDAAHAALMEIRVEAAMGAYNSDGTIGGGLTAIGCLDIVSACNAALQREQERLQAEKASLRLELDAAQHTKVKDNTYLLSESETFKAQRDAALAENARLKAAGSSDYVDWGSGELLAMAALDNYAIDDGLPKSTSVVYRIHQLGRARDAAHAALNEAHLIILGLKDALDGRVKSLAEIDAALAASAPQKECDHKFIDSNHCLKCGWKPPAHAQDGTGDIP